MRAMLIFTIVWVVLVSALCTKKQIVKPYTIKKSVQTMDKKPLKPVKRLNEPDFFDFKKELYETVYFSFDSDKIEDISAFHKIIEFANKFPDREVVLIGGCCPIGEWEYNRRLGLRRANSCYTYLRPLINNEMYVVSVGEEELETEDKSEYWLNRRCEVEIK